MSNSDSSPLLELKNFSVIFKDAGRLLPAVQSIDLQVPKGAIVSLVGESGCGKSLTARAILRLQPENASITGQMFFLGQDLLQLSAKEMQKIRGHKIAMIFQEPMTALNPVLTCGEQVTEVLQTHFHMDPKQAYERTCAMFAKVGIAEAERRFNSYPHQLSGGLRQRVMIAMALVAHPALLLADEPTTALDSTMCQQILNLIVEASSSQGMAVLMISHDLDTVQSFSDIVCVMYAGRIVERAQTAQLFDFPLHPYTQGLLMSSTRRITFGTKRLAVIKGSVPALSEMPSGCPFAPRCTRVQDQCLTQLPTLREIDTNHFVACFWPAAS